MYYRFNRSKTQLIISLLLVALMICPLLTGCSQYSDISYIEMARGTADVNSDYEITEKTYWNLLKADNTIDTIHDMKAMSLEPSTDTVTDVEYLKFDIAYKNEEVRTLWILYDFVLKKEYVLFEKQLYLLHDYRALWEQSVKKRLYDCGDARFYRNSDIDTMTFRYEQHWTDGADYEVYSDKYDFSNVEQPAEPFGNGDEAVNYYVAQLKLGNCESLCFYDEITGYYFIEFYNQDGFSTLNGENIENSSLGRGPEAIFAIIDDNDSIIELYSMGSVIYNYLFK